MWIVSLVAAWFVASLVGWVIAGVLVGDTDEDLSDDITRAMWLLSRNRRTS